MRVNDLLETFKPRVAINMLPYKKMYYYTQAAKGEVSGLGKVKRVNDTFFVTEVTLFKQESSGATTTLSADTMALFLHDLVSKGKNPADYNLWWHSHADFDTFWSGTDDENITNLSKNSLLVSICINKDGKLISRVDEKGTSYEDTPLIILPTGTSKLKARCFAEVVNKVSEPEPTIESFKTIDYTPFKCKTKLDPWKIDESTWPMLKGDGYDRLRTKLCDY